MFSHKKILIGVLAGLFLAWQFLVEPSGGIYAFAEPAGGFAAPAPTGLTSFLEGIGKFFDLCVFLVYVALYFLSFLLDPEIIFKINETAQLNGQPLLLAIWQMSRDIMNVIFAFMLVFAAIYTVVTSDRELVTTHIKKFILAVILVNFSWFFPRVILDVSNVLTATIYSIPSTIAQECKTMDSKGKLTECHYISRIYFFPEEGNAKVNQGCFAPKQNLPANILRPISQICMEVAPLPKEANTALGILHGMYVNHVRIISVGKVVNNRVPAGGFGKVEELARFIIQFLFTFLYLIASAFPLLAMMVVFFIRIPVIWITTAFMPFMFLGFIFKPSGIGLPDDFDTMGIFKKFVKAAFLPTVTAVPLVIGFIMITAGIQAPCPNEGAVGGLCLDQGFLIDGVKNFWVFMWNCLAIVVIWIGFYKAMSIDELYSGVGNFFQNIGQQWGKFALKAPLAMPIIGLPCGGNPNQSILGSLGGLPTLLKNPNAAIRDGKLNFRDVQTKGKQSGVDRNVAANTQDVNKDISKVLKQVNSKATNARTFSPAEMTALAQTFKRLKVFNAADIKKYLTSDKLETGLNVELSGDNTIDKVSQELERMARAERDRDASA